MHMSNLREHENRSSRLPWIQRRTTHAATPYFSDLESRFSRAQPRGPPYFRYSGTSKSAGNEKKSRMKGLEKAHAVESSTVEETAPEKGTEEDKDDKKGFIAEAKYLTEVLEPGEYGQTSAVLRTVPGVNPPAPESKEQTQSALHVVEVRNRVRIKETAYLTLYEKEPSELVINSPYLINALRTIVEYYPGETLSADTLKFKEPYRLIVHHLDQLQTYQVDHPNHADIEITVSHINILLDVINKACGESLKTETTLNKRDVPMTSYSTLWTLFKPGQFVYTNSTNDQGQPRVYVVSTIKQQEVLGPGRGAIYEISCWTIEYDGNSYKQVSRSFLIDPFQGEKEITFLMIYPMRFHKDTDPSRYLSAEIIERGRHLSELHKQSPAHRDYNGMTSKFPQRKVNGRVVIDAESYYQENPGESLALDEDDIGASQLQGCTCNNCIQARQLRYDKKMGKFESYANIPKEGPFTDEQLLLFPEHIHGWILQDRRWALLSINCVSKIKYDKNIFETLILPPDRSELINALVESHVLPSRDSSKENDSSVSHKIGRSASTSDPEVHTPYAADAIKGKGQGLLVLLHGPPGVGKTSTAECAAEFTWRPLFPITCGDLGTSPTELEENLQKSFNLAEKLRAVLLLDEADVFLQRRESDDLNRNSLVSVFLRILEYYTGILFLTTNRVGVFDEAITSRLHVILYYPKLNEREQIKIWLNHVKRLEFKRADINVRYNVREYIENDKSLYKPGFNGRQIRNIFQTAVSLAFFDARKNCGTPTLTEEHLRKVVMLSAEFQKYLIDTRESDSKMAWVSGTRCDDFGRGNRMSRKQNHEYDDR